eukprot:16449733-Heterocapsa_arctica.AAC.1
MNMGLTQEVVVTGRPGVASGSVSHFRQDAGSQVATARQDGGSGVGRQFRKEVAARISQGKVRRQGRHRQDRLHQLAGIFPHGSFWR